MAELAEKGCYTVDAETLARLQESFGCGWADDAQAAAMIRRRWEEDRYLCDPHTAVAFCVAEEQRGTAPVTVLSTASPFKFPRDVLAALGAGVPDSDFAAMEALTAATGSPGAGKPALPAAAACALPGKLDPAAIRAAALR